MKLLAFLAVFVLFLPAISFAYEVDLVVSVNRNDVVLEDFSIFLELDEFSDSFEFIVASKPLSIVFEGDYELLSMGNYYIIRFYKDLSPGVNELSFGLIYDNLVDRTRAGRVLRLRLLFPGVEDLNLRVYLPEGFRVSAEPSISPLPSSISSDGRRIFLDWKFGDVEEATTFLFYEGDEDSFIWLFVLLIFVSAGATIGFLVHKRKSWGSIKGVLSKDENLVLDMISRNVSKQKDIARNLGFSKSKMSKVVRKLEEKGLVERTPYFKTNILKIKK